VLKQALLPPDFKFSGLTLRSGGHEGLPADTEATDMARRHVHDGVMAERGRTGYLDLQGRALATIAPKGPDRIVKVIPVTPHSTAMKPSDQYPMGSGGLQWTLIRPCEFLMAMAVDANGIAAVAGPPPFSVFLGETPSYEDRARVARYLDAA